MYRFSQDLLFFFPAAVQHIQKLSLKKITHKLNPNRRQCGRPLMGCLHDPANVQQTFSNRNAGRLLEVCWTFAAICYDGARRLLEVC